MQFNSVPMNLSKDKLAEVKRQFLGLTLELGVREDNTHVGSGLGGNEYQLLVLLALKHHLRKCKSVEIELHDQGISWGSDFLCNKMSYIRKRLDDVFPAILEKNKLPALAMKSIWDNPAQLCQTFNKYEKSFPTVTELFKNRVYNHNGSLSLHEQFIVATLMTAKLAGDLDRGDTSLVEVVGQALNHFALEIVLLTVRRNIQIDRLVKWDLDEHPAWKDCLYRVNKGVDFKENFI